MKLLATILLSSSFLAPLALAQNQAEAAEIEVVDVELNEESVRYALYLSYKARVAQDFVEDELDSKRSRFYHSKAVRLCRTMNILALEFSDLLNDGGTELQLIDEKFSEIETLFYQIDSTKRTLSRYYRSQRSEIEDTFNDIRTATYRLKYSLYGEY